MAYPKFKQKCKVCKKEWVVVNYREYPICIPCHIRQIFSEEIKEKKYKFLDLPKEIYKKSRFLRNIRQNYLMYGSLTEKQITAFKKTAKDVKNPKKEDPTK